MPHPEPRPTAPMVPSPSPKKIQERSATIPAEEIACRARLTKLGIEFTPQPSPSDASGGCSLPYPVSVKSLGGGIELEPEALLNCQMAEAAARFLQGRAAKILTEEFPGSRFKSIEQVSGYVCRPRNGSAKLSEHALGNALDIAAFTMSNGSRMEVAATRHPQHSRFLSRLRTAACGPFKTVLGPGSNADHATHFHFDLEKRRNGSTVCD